MVTMIDDVAKQLGICRRTMYRFIRRLNIEIVYMDNGGKKKLAAIVADSETMSHLREAKINPRFNPLRPLDHLYRGNVVTTLKLRYFNRETKIHGVIDFLEVAKVELVPNQGLDYYRTKEYLITLHNGSQIQLRSKIDLINK